jgi:hypothetical protein
MQWAFAYTRALKQPIEKTTCCRVGGRKGEQRESDHVTPPCTSAATRSRDVGNKRKDANEQMKQRTEVKNRKAGLGRAEKAGVTEGTSLDEQAESGPWDGEPTLA